MVISLVHNEFRRGQGASNRTESKIFLWPLKTLWGRRYLTKINRVSRGESDEACALNICEISVYSGE